MREVYLMRHSEAIKPKNINNNDTLQVQNEKWVLSKKGEDLARKIGSNEIFLDFDMVFSSNYVRAISTAKNFTDDVIYIDENFGERRFGINNWDELPDNFEKRQFEDFDYKTSSGESLNEVSEREYDSLINILNNYKFRKILIVGHSTAFAALFTKWCNVTYDSGYYFKNEKFFDGRWQCCTTFKLLFNDDNELVDIFALNMNDFLNK